MSNMLNAVGVAPVMRMLQRGIAVGLGNDGWIFDPFENMRCALTVHRLAAGDPSVTNPLMILRMATIEAARCYNMDGQLGSIEVGKRGDIVVIDGRHLPTPLTASSAIGHIVHSVTGADVEHVFVDGEQVVQNHDLVRVSREQVAQASQESAGRLWQRLK